MWRKAIGLRDTLVIEKYVTTEENFTVAGKKRDYKDVAVFYKDFSLEDLMKRT